MTEDYSSLRPNNNQIDHDSFRKFYNRSESIYQALEKERLREECRLNLKDWLSRLPAPWKRANLTDIKNPAARKVDKILSGRELVSFYIRGKEGAGKTYLSYAILRRYIGKGWVLPSQVKFITEQELLSMAFTGYVGRLEFDSILKGGYTVFVVDNVGTRGSYQPERELLFWERFIDHVYSNSLTLILTSPYKLETFIRKLSPSGGEKIRDMVGGQTVFMPKDKDDTAEKPDPDEQRGLKPIDHLADAGLFDL